MLDIQNQKDKRGIGIEYVGINNVRMPLTIKASKGKIYHVMGTIALYTDLSAENRGTHMSRYIEVMQQYHMYSLSDSVLKNISSHIQKVLKAENVTMSIAFAYPIKKISPVSKKSVYDAIDCVIKVNKIKSLFQKFIVVKVPVMLLCPCSKAISKYNAHNQRALVTLTIHSNKNITIEKLVDLIEEEASCRLYPLLKRIDEKFVTEYSYENPKFVEDIVRDITLKLRKNKYIVSLNVKCESYESIHSHNAYAELSYGIKN